MDVTRAKLRTPSTRDASLQPAAAAYCPADNPRPPLSRWMTSTRSWARRALGDGGWRMERTNGRIGLYSMGASLPFWTASYYDAHLRFRILYKKLSSVSYQRKRPFGQNPKFPKSASYWPFWNIPGHEKLYETAVFPMARKTHGKHHGNFKK